MRLVTLILITVIFLSACGGGGDAPTTETLPPTAPPTRLAEVQPTDPPPQPSDEPSQPTDPPVAPTDTASPTSQPEPTATLAPTDAPAPTPAPAVQGRVSFRDSLAVADQLVLSMQGIAPPPDGSVYEGWLIADDGVTEISSGVFEVGADGSVDYAWTSPSGENLIAQYASFAVTIEPADDGDPGPSSEIAFRGAADPGTLAAARRVFAINAGEPATPRNVSYGQGLLAESEVAKDHALNAFNAAAIGAHAEMRSHIEHLINTIEGAAGPRFSDYTGDGRAENPGDGFGALAYARQISALLPDTNGGLGAVEGLLIAIQDKALEILDAPDVAAAQPALNELKTLGERLLAETAPGFYTAAQVAVSFSIAPTP